MALDKKELGEYVAANHGLSNAEGTRIVDSVFKRLADEIASHGEVNIHAFGKFVTTDRPARTGRNPSNGAAIEIPAKTAISFKPSKTLKDAAN